MTWQETFEDSTESFKIGLSAAIAGDPETARIALWAVVGDDPRHEVAWLWLAKVAETQEERQLCLTRALEIDPRNSVTRSLLIASQEDRDDLCKPLAKGHCPICGLPWAKPPTRCLCCGCVQGFSDPAVFLSALDIDRRLAQKKVDHLERQCESQPAPELRRLLALCYLNLGDLFEARRHVRGLCHLDPSDEQLRELLMMLSGRLEAIQVESGFETESIDRPTLEELSLI